MLNDCPNWEPRTKTTGICHALQRLGLSGGVAIQECHRCKGDIASPTFQKIVEQARIEAAPSRMTPLKEADDLPCLYRGNVLRELECQGCVKKMQQVYECRLAGSCSIRTIMNSRAPAATCLGCQMREPLPALSVSVVMACWNNYAEAAQTIAGLDMMHSPRSIAEFIVSDNAGEGWQTQALKDHCQRLPRCRYVDSSEIAGPCHAKDKAIREATGDLVVCLDSHVVVESRGIDAIRRLFESHLDFHGLCVGPLRYDSGAVETEFRVFNEDGTENWSDGMLGQWMCRDGYDPDGEPFPIITSGMGLFACRREDWVGFDMACRGFGGEEFYISEAFRQRFGEGRGATICVPQARWWHRFRQQGEGSSATWESKLRNNLLHFRLLGMDDSQLMAHFREKMGQAADELRSTLFRPMRHS